MSTAEPQLVSPMAAVGTIVTDEHASLFYQPVGEVRPVTGDRTVTPVMELLPFLCDYFVYNGRNYGLCTPIRGPNGAKGVRIHPGLFRGVLLFAFGWIVARDELITANSSLPLAMSHWRRSCLRRDPTFS